MQLSLKDVQLLFFSATLSQKNGKLILYFDKTNKIANRLFLYNLHFNFLCDTFFPLKC